MTEPITEEQGDKIVALLNGILCELKNISQNSSSIEFEVKFELQKIRERLTDLKR